MFYKHWKKLALALTGFFWASCDFGSSTTEEAALYGCPPEGCHQDSPNSSNSNLSSSDKSSSSETAGQSSDNKKDDSSSSVEPKSSSSFDMQVVPLYGVQLKDLSSSSMQKISSSSEGEKVPCNDVSSDRQTLTREKDNGITMLECKDGVTCQEKVTESWASEFECIDDICPDYGVVRISEKMYACDDGNVYNEAEFLSRYHKKSNVIDKDSLDAPIAVYGPPCYFDGTCRDDNEE